MLVVYAQDFNSEDCQKNIFDEIGVDATFEPVSIKNIYKCDLFILMGGADINPALYGQENTYSSFNLQRDKEEVYWLMAALRLEKKIFGICRGHQLLNAIYAGQLVQDINPAHSATHYISNLEGEKWLVNSYHHQGVKEAGSIFIPLFYSEDGLVEMTESLDDWILSVQFHPEWCVDKKFYKYFAEWLHA